MGNRPASQRGRTPVGVIAAPVLRALPRSWSTRAGSAPGRPEAGLAAVAWSAAMVALGGARTSSAGCWSVLVMGPARVAYFRLGVTRVDS